MVRQCYLLFVLIFSLFASGAHAQEYISEAQVRAPYGSQGDSWGLLWSGVCAPRVAVDVTYNGRSFLNEKQQQVIDYLRNTAKHVVARCPEVEILHVLASGGKRNRENPVGTWRFQLHKASNWQITEQIWVNEATFAQQYAQGAHVLKSGAPVIRAILEFEQGQLQGLYGAKLHGSLTSDAILKRMLPETTPARLQYYEIKGFWYELGEIRGQPVCEMARNGYPQWGRFSLLIYPNGNNSYLNRTFCTEDGQTGKSQQLPVRNYQDLVTKSGPRDTQSLQQLASKLSKLTLSSGETREEFLARRKPLYQSTKLTIYAKDAEFCLNKRFDVYYPMPSEEREQAFEGNYKASVGAVLSKVLRQHCKEATRARVYSAQQGSSEPWDSHSFQFKPLTKAEQYLTLTYPRVVDYHAYDRAKAHQLKMLQHHFGEPCVDQPFCALTAGNFLNAIYRGDVALLVQAEQMHQQEFEERLPGLSNDQKVVANFLQRLVSHKHGVGLLVMTANKYMYHYPNWGQQCFEDGASARTFVETTDASMTINFDGSIDSEPDQQRKVTYTTNPEFAEIRDLIGPSYMGAPSKGKDRLTLSYRQILQGLEQMQRNYPCNAPEVKQFEQNLIHFTQRQLAKKPLDGTMVAPTVLPDTRPRKRQPADKQQVESTAGTPRVISPPAAPAATESVPTPDVQGAAKEQAPDTRAANGQQQRQQMAEELEALSQQVADLLQRAQTKLKQDMRSASSAQQRNELMLEFQALLQKINAEAKQKTEQIKRKYQ